MNGSFVICGQAEKMLRARLDTANPNQTIAERVESAAGLGMPMGDTLNVHIWLSNNLDMDIWTYLTTIPCWRGPKLG